jgi:hypothetical protein
VKYNSARAKNCAIGGNNFDGDSGSFVDRQLLECKYCSSSLRLVGNIRHRRFFPKQEEKVASIEPITEAL